MKKLLLAAAAIALSAPGLALADDTNFPPEVQVRPSSLTRAEVRAATIDASRHGALQPKEALQQVHGSPGTRSRAEVAA